MNWFEKEDRYAQAYESGRISSNLWKYVPKNKMDAVSNCFADSDGYWAWLEHGYRAYDCGDDCGIIHEYTIADFKDAIKSIEYSEDW